MTLTWTSFEYLAERICAIIAGFTNGLLLHLIINKSPKSFGIYKHLLIFICLFEIIYAFIDALMVPTLFTDASSFFIVMEAQKTMIPKQFMVNCIVIYCYFFGVSVAICNFLFIFRYLVINGKKKWIQNKPHIIIFWISLPIFSGVLWALFSWLFCGPSDVNDRYLQDRFLDQAGSSLNQVGYFGFNLYLTVGNGTVVYNWKNMGGVFAQTILCFVSSSLMLIFGYKCYNSIHQLTSLSTSSRHRNLQLQLFFALVFQNAIPICLMHIPAGLVCLTAFFSSSSPIIGKLLSVSIAFYPAIDPLPNIMIIGQYRQAVLGYLRCGRENSRSATDFVEMGKV